MLVICDWPVQACVSDTEETRVLCLVSYGTMLGD